MSLIKKIFSGKKKTPQELMIDGNYKAALQGFQEILKQKRKSDPTIEFQMADCYLKLKQPQNALKYYIKVGEYYGEMGFFNKSVAIFKKALNISPNNQDILSKLAAFNDKVPKYMIDDQFLNKARGEKESPEPEDKKAEDEFNFGAELECPAPSTAAKDEAFEETPAGFSVEPLPDTEEVQPSTLEISPSDLEMDEPDQPEPSAQVVPENAIDAQEQLWDMEIDFETSPLTQELEQAAKQGKQSKDAKVTRKENEGMVFSSRIHEAEKKSSGPNMAFDSVDDALDSLFAPAAPAPAPPPKAPEPPPPATQTELDKKHWSLFRTMPKKTFIAFIIALQDHDYEPGEYIVKQGEAGDTMYLISDGKVDVQVEKDSEILTVATLESGDFFGEASLLTKKPRNASVVCREKTTVLLLGYDQLVKLAKEHPSVVDNIKKIYVARMRQNMKNK